MKVLFFHIGTPTPILGTELELVREHELRGDSVRMLQCTGNLPNCHWNQRRGAAQCAACRSRFSNGWRALHPGSRVELRQFPPIDLSPFELPAEFADVEAIKRFRHDGENLGFGVASGLISLLRDHRFDTRLHRDKVYRELCTAVQVYETLKKELLEFRPDRVYIFNCRIATHLPAYLLCKKLKIEFLSYEMTGKGNSYKLRLNKTVHAPLSREEVDSIRAAWTPQSGQVAEEVLRKRRLGQHLAKIPVFTAEQTRGLLPKGFSSEKRNIAIFNSTIDEYAGIEGWEGRLYRPDETVGIRRILEDFEGDAAFMFYLRVHPHMKGLPASTSQLADIAELATRFSNLHVIWPGEDIDSYGLLDACEKVITFGSTIGSEATYWGKPSIAAAHASYENFGCVYRPATHAELVQLVRENLAPLARETALPYFFWEVADGIAFKHFRETGLKNGLPTGTFDGVEIRPSRFTAFLHELHRFVVGAASAMATPSTALERLRRYAKTIR